MGSYRWQSGGVRAGGISVVRSASGGWFSFSINFSYLSCAMGFLALGLVRGSSRKVWLLLAAAGVLVACVLTLSRGGIFAILLLLVLLMVLNFDRLGWKVPLAGLVAVEIGRAHV